MLTQYLNHKTLLVNKLLILTISVCLSSTANAQSTFLGIAAKKPEVGYYSMVLNRFFGWYKQNLFDFDKTFNENEKKLVKTVIDEINQSREYLDSETEVAKFRLVICATGDHLDYGNIFVALNSNSKLSFDLAKKIIKQRNLKIPKNFDLKNLVGMQWSFEQKTISLFFKIVDEVSKPSEDFGYEFQQIDFSKNEVIRQIHWGLPEAANLKSGLFIDGVTEERALMSNEKKMSYVASTLLPTRIFTEKLKDPLRKITKEFGFGPQAALIEDQLKVWIYY